MKAHIHLLARVKRLSQALTLKHAVATGIVQSLVLACMTVFSSTHAFAQIAFIKTIGTASSKTSGTNTSITVPASGVGIGHSVIVALAMDPIAGAVSCSDSRGNSYSQDSSVTNGSGTSGVRSFIFSAHNVVALSSGHTITCSHPSVAARAISANEFSGLMPVSPIDITASSQGSGTSAVTSSAPIKQDLELLVEVIGVEGPISETFTPGVAGVCIINEGEQPWPYTTAGRAGTSGTAAASNITVNPAYVVAASKCPYYGAGAFLGNSRNWGALFVAYKAPPTTATKLVITSVNNGGNVTTDGFFVTIQILLKNPSI